LDGFKNSEKRSGTALKLCDHLVDQELFLRLENLRDDFIGGGWHDSSPPCNPDRL
jgi:hypothetical protein